MKKSSIARRECDEKVKKIWNLKTAQYIKQVLNINILNFLNVKKKI